MNQVEEKLLAAQRLAQQEDDLRKAQRLEGLPANIAVKAKSELGRNVEILAEMFRSKPIYDVNGEMIDTIWAAEFRGFFWGEGSLTVNEAYSIDVMMTQREDAGDVLREFQHRLGGNIRIKGYYDGTDRRVTTWQTSVPKLCLRVAALLSIGDSGIPFHKKRQLDLWIEAIFLKMGKQQGYKGKGYQYTPENRARMAAITVELRELRRWHG